MKTAYWKFDFFGQIEFQIIATGKSFEMDETNFKSSIRNSSFAGKKSQVKFFTQSRVKAMDFNGGQKSKIRR